MVNKKGTVYYYVNCVFYLVIENSAFFHSNDENNHKNNLYLYDNLPEHRNQKLC